MAAWGRVSRAMRFRCNGLLLDANSYALDARHCAKRFLDVAAIVQGEVLDAKCLRRCSVYHLKVVSELNSRGLVRRFEYPTYRNLACEAQHRTEQDYQRMFAIPHNYGRWP